MTYLINDSTAGTALEVFRKEQVEDLIINLFPLDTPLHQILGARPMTSYLKQPVDTFSSALINRVSSVFAAGDRSTNWNASSAKPEGHTYASYTEGYGALMISGVAEIQGLQFSVSDSDRNEPLYGMTDRFAYEALKATESVVNMFEHSFWWSPGTPPAGSDLNTSTGTQYARQTQGICHWILKSGLQRSQFPSGGSTAHTDGHGNDFGSSGTLYNYARGYAYDAGGVTLDQAMFKDNLMAEWYNLTGRQAGAVGFTGAKIKNLFSQFALTANGPINERTLEAAAKRVVDTVDYYETDFGVLSVNMCRYLNLSGQSVNISTSSSTNGDTTNTIPYDEVLILIKPEFFQIGVKRPVYMSPLGKTGDFESGLVRGEKGLICRNPQAGAGISNCLA